MKQKTLLGKKIRQAPFPFKGSALHFDNAHSFKKFCQKLEKSDKYVTETNFGGDYFNWTWSCKGDKFWFMAYLVNDYYFVLIRENEAS